MEAVLLTGYLGSGKTTLLGDWLASGDPVDVAVVVNEAGEVGFDGVMLAQAGSSAGMRMLDNGCLCCSQGADLAVTIAELAAEHLHRHGRPLQRVVIEASGLSRPGPLLRTLNTQSHRLVGSVRIVGAYDAVRARDLERVDEAVAQWATADVLVMTKTDLLSQAEGEAAADHAGRMAPMAELIREGGLAAALATAPATPRFRPEMMRRVGDHGVHSLLVRPSSVEPAMLLEWLDDLTGLLGEQLLRLKGVVRLAGGGAPVAVQSVGTVVSGLRPLRDVGEDLEPFIVVMARGVDLALLSQIDPEGRFPIAA